MVSVSIGVLIAVIVFFAIAFAYIIFFAPKGRKVIIEFYEEMSNGAWFRIDAHKVYKGLIYRTKEGVEKFKVPKKFSKLPLEAINIDCLTPSNNGVPVVKLVKDAEGLFRPTQIQFDDKKKFKAKVEEREPLSWLFQEMERIQKQYAKNDLWSKIAPLAMLGVVVLGGLLTIYGTGQQINELNDDYREQTLGEITQQRSFVLDLVNNIKGENNNNVTTSDSAQKPPGAQ